MSNCASGFGEDKMPALKKCYYDILGVERNATDDDIKKSFRKLALQLHPDKNLDRGDEAKTEFQDLQQAYEVLSNPQERAWYDEHRHAILRGGLNQDFADDSIDIMAYCSSSCYKGFGDDAEGFYVVYQKLFEKITAEEIEAGLEDSDEELPSFGDYMSSYETDVGPFYAFWESFCTRKNFAWLDEHDTRHAGCRRISRLMDKENKKLRSEAKKDWNQRVRALVDFVKRKDKRVQAWKAEQEIKLKEKEATLAKKFAEDKAKRLDERKKLLESVKKKGNSLSSSDGAQLKEMEAWVANEFGDANEETSSEEEDCLYCEVCNKSFRTEKAFMNHEKSKKHLQQIQVLRQRMEVEDEQFGNTDEDPDDEDVEVNESEAAIEVPYSSNFQTDETSHSQPVILEDKIEAQMGEEEIAIGNHEEDETLLLKNFGNMKLKNVYYSDEDNIAPIPAESHLNESESNPSSSKTISQNEQVKNKKRRRAVKSSKAVESVAEDNSTENNIEIQTVLCMKCDKNFENKNQLFKHLKQYPEHAVLKNGINLSTIKSKKGKNRK